MKIFFLFQFIITSRYYTKELQQIIYDDHEVFVSMESHFDQYYLSSENEETRPTEICRVKPNQKCLQLRSMHHIFHYKKSIPKSISSFVISAKLMKLSNLKSNKRVVVVCTTEETAKCISNTIMESYKLANLLNQSKTQIANCRKSKYCII